MQVSIGELLGELQYRGGDVAGGTPCKPAWGEAAN